MKKIISILLVLIVLLGLVGCDITKNGNEDVNSNVSDVTKQEYVKVIGKEKYDFTESEPLVHNDTGLKNITKTYTLKDKVDFEVPKNLKIADTEITVLTTAVNTLLNGGWTVVAGKAADQPQKAKQATNTSVKNANGDIATLYAVNRTDKDIPFGECLINKVRIKYEKGGIINDTADFSISEKINKSSSYADIVDVLGEPNRVYVSEHYDGDEYMYHSFTITYSDSVGNTIQFSFSNEADKNNEKMVEMRIDF